MNGPEIAPFPEWQLACFLGDWQYLPSGWTLARCKSEIVPNYELPR
jgi:hypothetical protein